MTAAVEDSDEVVAVRDVRLVDRWLTARSISCSRRCERREGREGKYAKSGERAVTEAASVERRRRRERWEERDRLVRCRLRCCSA